MKKLIFNTTINSKSYSFYATWDNDSKITTMFSSTIDGNYDGQLSLYGKQANNFLYCLDQINITNIGNKHQSKQNNIEDCILTYHDDVLIQNKWNMYTFPHNVDYLYTAIALCDTKFLNIFKKRAII